MTPLMKYFCFGGKWNSVHPDPVANRARYQSILVKVDTEKGSFEYKIPAYDINALDQLTSGYGEIKNVEVLERL